MYEAGKCVKQDCAIALDWFRKAADQGNTAGQGFLGNLHEYGADVPKDQTQAYKWYSLAAINVDGSVRDDAQQGRDGMAATLSPAQIAAMDAEIKAWKPRWEVTCDQ